MDSSDHRILGPSLGLFHQQDDAPGTVFWHEKGTALWLAIEGYIRSLLVDHGYGEVRSPQLVQRSLFDQSGHTEKYLGNMFVFGGDLSLSTDLALKPMNCPCHVQIFNKRVVSYRDLPLRLAEFGSCMRNEPAGSMHGIMRLRTFTQDDAHIFCTEEQIQSEVYDFIELLETVYRKFGFGKPSVKLATRPPVRLGNDDFLWEKAEVALRKALNDAELPFEINEGQGAFYGPKIEFSIKDVDGREWQLGTIQLDFNLPGRMGAHYTDENNVQKSPIMLHRAILGSFERFIGILIEHHRGAFPFWLAPVQVQVIPISDKYLKYAQFVAAKIGNRHERSYRVAVNEKQDKLGAKIRDAQMNKIPYMFVVGEKEEASESVSVRHREQGDRGVESLSDFITYLHGEP